MNIPFVDLRSQYKHLEPEIRESIDKVLEHGQFIMGPEVFQLEKELAKFTGSEYVITCSSGTDALLMSLMAKNIGPGDAVFTSTFSFIATAEVISLLGATPVFVDINEDTFNIDINKLEQAVQKYSKQGSLLPKCIIPVDIFGLPCDYDALNSIVERYDLFLISDSAQSLGGKYQDRAVGTLSQITTTSFFPAKPLGCYGDGGAIFTSDDEFAQELKSIRLHGKGHDKYDNVRIGLNGRLDTLQAAVLIPKLGVLSEEIKKRNELAQRYTTELSGIVKTPEVPNGYESAWAQYSILLSSRDNIKDKLNNNGVPTVIYYPKPLHLQTVFRDLGYKIGDFPVAENVANKILSLPVHPYLTDHDQLAVIDAIKDVLRKSR